MAEEIENRLAAMEIWKNEVTTQLFHTQEGLITLAQEGQEERKSLSSNYIEALKIQANSLSIPLLRDILMPMMMKVFTFFAALVMLLLGGVLGIKWIFGDVLARGVLK